MKTPILSIFICLLLISISFSPASVMSKAARSSWLSDDVLTDPATNYCPNIIRHGSDVFLVYNGRDNYTYAVEYKNGRWSDPVKMPIRYVSEPHNAPVISANKDGKLIVFAGGHDSSITSYWVSNVPWSVTDGWTAYQSPTSTEAMTYPLLMRHPGNGSLYLFYRQTAGVYYYWKLIFSRDGITWGSRIAWSDVLSPSFLPYLTDTEPRWQYHNGKWVIWFPMVWYFSSTTRRQGAFLVYLDVEDHHVYNVTDTDLGTTWSSTEILQNCVVYNVSVPFNYYAGVTFQSDGKPFVVTSRPDATGYSEFISLRWTGSTWGTPKVITSTTDNTYNWLISGLMGNGTKIRFNAWTGDGTIKTFRYNETTDSWSYEKTILTKEMSPQGQGWERYGVRVSNNIGIVAEKKGTYPIAYALIEQIETGEVVLFGTWTKNNIPTDNRISGLITLTMNMLMLAIVVGVITTFVMPIVNDPKKRTTENMIRATINVVICIVVGTIMIVVTNKIALGG